MTPAEIRAVVADLATLPDRDDAPLDVDSLTLVSIVEALEDHFSIRVAPREVVPENFATIAAIAAFVARKRA
jgi:acyl carrier protein